MVFPDIESGAGRKPMKNMAQDGNRTRRIIGTGGTLGACRQYQYLVRTPAPRGGSSRSVVLGSFSTARVVCERWRARAWFSSSSSSSFMKGALGEDRDIYRSTRVREENPKAKAGSHRRTDLKYMTLS